MHCRTLAPGSEKDSPAAGFAAARCEYGALPYPEVRDLGVSPDGHAVQVEALSNVSQGDSTAVTNLVDGLRSAISRAGPPQGLSVHLAGAIPVAVDQQKQTGNTGNQIQGLSVVFIIILLLLIFRAALAPLITLLPAFIAITIAGPLVAAAAQAGLKVSQLAQILLIVLVLGAGTDYGLFLVFRVREALRRGMEPKEAVISSLTRVGESITFSAATVIAALLSLLVATFQIYSTLGIPLAIGIGVMLLAGLTLLPALLAIFGRAAFWPSKTREGTGKVGVWGRVATRIVQHPGRDPHHRPGGLRRSGRGLARIQGSRFRRRDERAGAQRFAACQSLLDQALPEQHGQPHEHHLQAEAARLGRSGPRSRAPGINCPAAGCSPRSTGPLDPTGYALTPAQYAALHARLGAGQAAAAGAAGRAEDPGGGIPALPGDRAVREPGRPHDPVRHRPEGR